MNAIKLLLISLFVVALGTTSEVQAATYYFHTDHLGTPQALTDVNQQVVWQGEQDPFGENTPTVNLVEQNLRFPGQYFDTESGLHYNYFRTYDSSIGRYTQSDPIGLAGGLNTFSYVLANPVVSTDTIGLARKTVSLGEGYSGAMDTFSTGGSSSFEIHVRDPSGNEIGIYGPDGWINKHGKKGRPDGIPESVENQCRGKAVDIGRRMGVVPEKGIANIKGDRLRKFLKSLMGTTPILLDPSPVRVPPDSPISEYM